MLKDRRGRFEVLMSVAMKVNVLRDVTLCILVDV
jgi:hypothetical protein